jgi:formyltetrahydrofolate-dependent phosphoribosylglycinamide formyltransferase
MIRMALLFSGSGGNALNLLEACRQGRIPAEPALGLASTAQAGGIVRLRAAGLPVAVLARPGYPDDRAFSEACYAQAEAAGAELIALCGWLKKLEVPARWAGRIVNIHPGLLPAFGGAGMWGMHVHRAVLAAGAAESGCTVHLVDNLYDHGRILAQARVPVLPGDTAEALQRRVYEQEMRLYPLALAEYLETLRS